MHECPKCCLSFWFRKQLFLFICFSSCMMYALSSTAFVTRKLAQAVTLLTFIWKATPDILIQVLVGFLSSV
jgi:hypothetical protein